eukprot:4670564-Amphidinium_carterae.1
METYQKSRKCQEVPENVLETLYRISSNELVEVGDDDHHFQWLGLMWSVLRLAGDSLWRVAGFGAFGSGFI